MTPRLTGETQRAYVERVLREDGVVRAYSALFELRYTDGSKCSITRLAATIETLRKDGWRIATEGGHGELATYRLLSQPNGVPAPAPWQRGWHCTACGALPASEPTPLLGDSGQATCRNCGGKRIFRRAA